MNYLVFYCYVNEEKKLENSGFEVITEKVNQSDLIEFINNQNIEVILVRSATQVRKDIIDNCPSIKIIGTDAFWDCKQLTDAVFGKDLEGIEGGAFHNCPALRRIAIPLKNNILVHRVFDECDNLSQVDLVGWIHKTISSLHMESWRDEMYVEIDMINQTLPARYKQITLT